MFEKEAEEYFDSMKEDWNEELERTGKRHYFVGFDIKRAFSAGAKSGYNRGLEEGRKEATQRLKNCMNCEKRRTCKTWHLVCGLEAANTANYNCVCLDKWEIAEECEAEKCQKKRKKNLRMNTLQA